MKKAYEKPRMEMTEFRFSEHIAASGNNCYWGGGETYTHGYSGCRTNTTTLPDSWIGQNG